MNIFNKSNYITRENLEKEIESLKVDFKGIAKNEFSKKEDDYAKRSIKKQVHEQLDEILSDSRSHTGIVSMGIFWRNKYENEPTNLEKRILEAVDRVVNESVDKFLSDGVFLEKLVKKINKMQVKKC